MPALDGPANWVAMIPDLFHPLAAPFRLDGTNGSAVVLLHGFTGVPAHFRPLATALHRHGYTVTVPLLAGHGTSIDDMAQTDHRDWYRSAELAVRAVSDHHRVHVAGLSMGGLLGIQVAARLATSSVTTINSPVIVRNPRLYLAPFASWAVPTVLWDADGRITAPQELAAFDLTYPGFHTSSARHLLRVVVDAYRTAHRLRRPSLVIQSRTDETVHPSSAVLLRRALGPGCSLLWLDSARHNSLLDPAAERITHALLSRIRTATSGELHQQDKI